MAKSAKHITIWGAWYGSHNVGDQALLLSITDILAMTLGEVRFTVFTDNPAHVRLYTSRESDCQIDVVHNQPQFYRIFYTLATCDLFIFGGGVPFYQQPCHVLVMAMLVSVARFFRTPYMTWTVSSQEIDSPGAKRVFGWVLNGAQAITYRDEHTGELFASCGVTRPMYHTADPAYWLRAEDEASAIEVLRRTNWQPGERPLVALTPRTLRSKDGEAETHYNVKTPAQFEQEIDCFAAALDWAWDNGYQPIFIPMNTVAPDDDRLAARIVMQRACYGKHALLVDEEIRPRVAPALYRQCHLSFVGRVHGSITSLIGNCPVMMYAFAPKHAGIMAAMGLSAYTLLETVAAPDRTQAMLADLTVNREQVQKAMKERLETLRQEALLPAQMAKSILGM